MTAPALRSCYPQRASFTPLCGLTCKGTPLDTEALQCLLELLLGSARKRSSLNSQHASRKVTETISLTMEGTTCSRDDPACRVVLEPTPGSTKRLPLSVTPQTTYTYCCQSACTDASRPAWCIAQFLKNQGLPIANKNTCVQQTIGMKLAVSRIAIPLLIVRAGYDEKRIDYERGCALNGGR